MVAAAGMVVIWIAVMSHWVLDGVTHRPDMPLYRGGPRFGLGLWNSVAGTMVVEIAMFVAGVWPFMHTGHAHETVLDGMHFLATSCCC
jgi:hypothetical protein